MRSRARAEVVFRASEPQAEGKEGGSDPDFSPKIYSIRVARSTAIRSCRFLANAQVARSPGRSACGALVMRTRTSRPRQPPSIARPRRFARPPTYEGASTGAVSTPNIVTRGGRWLSLEDR